MVHVTRYLLINVKPEGQSEQCELYFTGYAVRQ